MKDGNEAPVSFRFFSFFFHIYSFGCSGSQLCHMGSLVAACGIWFPDQGLNPGALHWERRVLAIGPAGKSTVSSFRENGLNVGKREAVFAYPPPTNGVQLCSC